MDFKMAESYNEMKSLRAKEMQLPILQNGNDKCNQISFRYGLTKEQIEVTEEIVKNITSDDPDISGRAMIDFLDQCKLLSHRIVSILKFTDIQRIISYLENQFFAELSLNILRIVSEYPYSVDDHNLINFLEYADFFLNQPNIEFVSCTIIIIGNVSIRDKEFRDEAFKRELFTKIKDCEIANQEEVAWCLFCALQPLRFDELDIEDKISDMLINLSENSDYKIRIRALKSFYFLESNDCTSFHEKIVENQYIRVLTDILNASEKPKYKTMALTIITGCCMNGSDCLRQIFDYDTINFYIEMIKTDPENVDDENIICLIDLLINSFVSQCDDEIIFKLVEYFCIPDIQNLLEKHSTSVYTKAINAIQRLFYVTENPKVLEAALSPFLIERLSDLLFIGDTFDEDGDATLNVLLIFENIITRLLIDETSPILKNVILMLKDVVEKEDYYKLLYDVYSEKDNLIAQHATILKTKVDEIIQAHDGDQE